jgi:hypothetical protein
LISEALPTIVKVRNDAINSTDVSVLPDIPSDPWSWYNLKGDLAALIAHCILGIVVLVWVESPVRTLFYECSFIDFMRYKEIEEIDEDVLAEEERVDMMDLETEYLHKESFTSTNQNDSQFFKDTYPNRQSAIRVHQLYRSYDKSTHAI